MTSDPELLQQIRHEMEINLLRTELAIKSAELERANREPQRSHNVPIANDIERSNRRWAFAGLVVAALIAAVAPVEQAYISQHRSVDCVQEYSQIEQIMKDHPTAVIMPDKDVVQACNVSAFIDSIRPSK
jgi:hypothetical protein